MGWEGRREEGGHCWSEVTGLCVSGMAAGTCGAGIMIQPIHKKSGPVRGRNSLDAELGGCGMLMENLSQWIDKSLHESYMHFLEECLARGTVTEPPDLASLRVACGSGVRGFVALVFVGEWVMSSNCQTTSIRL